MAGEGKIVEPIEEKCGSSRQQHNLERRNPSRTQSREGGDSLPFERKEIFRDAPLSKGTTSTGEGKKEGMDNQWGDHHEEM